MRTLFVSATSLFFVLGMMITPVNAQTFNVNLTIGSRGADVISLQQILVAKGFLQMPSGVLYGYFGPLTRAAVARWQAANEIIPPAGFFGPISRATIATQVNTPAVSPVTTINSTPPISAPVSRDLFPNVETDASAALGMRVGQVMLFRAYPFEVRPGDFITLDGSGFSKTINKVYFNNGNPITATSTDGVTMKLSVPTALSDGEYKLSISNAFGSSDNPDIQTIIKVTSNPYSGPIIESVSIVGDTVILTGKGFTSANNLFTTFGDLASMISASGNTLTFHLSDLSFYDQIKNSTLGQKYQAALWIYVQNEHGVNRDPYKLDIII